MQSPLFKEFTPSDYDQWRREAERLLKGASFEKKMRRTTLEGITLEAIYRAEDIEALSLPRALPGFAPFVRGTRAIRDERCPWIIAQEAGACGLESTRAQVKEELAKGATAVHLKLDAASGRGWDADAPDAVSEASSADRSGASISSMSDLAFVLDSVDLSVVPVFIQCGSAGLAHLGVLAALAETRGIAADSLQGAVAMDPLCALAGAGALPLSLEAAYDEMGAMTAWARNHAPNLRTLWVHGNLFHDAGADAAQELAFTLAIAVESLRAMETRGIPPEACADSMVIGFSMGTHFFMEVAKLRAARVLLHSLFEACGAPDGASRVRIHANTSRFTQTRNDFHVNLLRATTQAMSSVIGGADSLYVTPHDEALKTSDDFSRRLARNIQLMVRDEAHLGGSMDPAGGSWFVERLTRELADAAWRLFREVEAKGGMHAALKDGLPQDYIADTNRARGRELASRRRIIVGVNQYPDAAEILPGRDERKGTTDRGARAEEVAAWKASRANDVALALDAIKEAGPEAWMERVIEAAARNATVGEICAALPSRLPSRKTGKGSSEVSPLDPMRAAEPFERLRARVEAHFADFDGSPAVFLATLGPVGRYMPRLDFAASFFEAGGFKVTRTSGFGSPDEAADRALSSGAGIAVICGLDEDYAASAARVTRRIKKKCPAIQVVLAGRPGQDEEARYREAGVDFFIFAGVDLLETLTVVAEGMGVEL